MSIRWIGIAAVVAGLAPCSAYAWGHEGHEVIAEIARTHLTLKALAATDAILKTDVSNNLTAHDMASEATWADAYRGAGHRETASWHFVDLELDNPDLKAACFGFPPAAVPASSGPAQDCVVDKINEFAGELINPNTPADEKLLALKFLIHFVGDIHQPLHASDNHDRGGNCVQVSLGGVRTTNLHSYWDGDGSTPCEIRSSAASQSSSTVAEWPPDTTRQPTPILA